MRVLLIGGNGFLGSHILDALRLGDFEISVLDRKPESYREPLPGVRYFLGDLRDTALLDRALEGVDCVVHLSTSSIPASSNQDPAADIRRNLLPLLTLLDRMHRLEIKQMIYFSSGGAIYKNEGLAPLSEDHPLGPNTSYGVVKIASEHYLEIECQQRGLRCVRLRPSNPYGARQGRIGVQGVVNTLLWCAAQNQVFEIWGDGQVRRDFIDVRDVARLCVRSIDGSATGCFNVGTGLSSSIAEIIALVREISGREFKVLSRPGRREDKNSNVLNNTAAKNFFDWRPQIDLQDGIADAWDWVRRQAR